MFAKRGGQTRGDWGETSRQPVSRQIFLVSSRPNPSCCSRLISCPVYRQALFRETNERETDCKQLLVKILLGIFLFFKVIIGKCFFFVIFLELRAIWREDAFTYLLFFDKGIFNSISFVI